MYGSVTPKNSAESDKVESALNQLVTNGASVLQYPYISGKTPTHFDKNAADLTALAGASVDIDGPYPIYLETITNSRLDSVLSRSADGQNRIYINIEELDSGLVDLIGRASDDVKAGLLDPARRVSCLREALNFRDDWIRKIVSFGPRELAPNVLVNETKGIDDVVQNLESALKAGFQWAINEGPLMDQPVYGCHINFTDLVVRGDPTSTNDDMTILTRRVIHGAILAASPGVCEPMLNVTLEGPESMGDTAEGQLAHRRGITLDRSTDQDQPGTTRIEAILPAETAIGFDAAIDTATDGKFKLTYTGLPFYQPVPGDPTDTSSNAYDIVQQVRARKGLSVGPVPDSSEYLDKT